MEKELTGLEISTSTSTSLAAAAAAALTACPVVTGTSGSSSILPEEQYDIEQLESTEGHSVIRREGERGNEVM